MDWNFFTIIQKPLYQALLFLILTPVLIFIRQSKSVDTAWSIAVIAFVLFIILNSAMLWFSIGPWRYFFTSIGFGIGYILVIGIVMQGLAKVLRLEGSGESAMAFLVIIYQPPGLLLVMAIRWMVMKWF